MKVGIINSDLLKNEPKLSRKNKNGVISTIGNVPWSSSIALDFESDTIDITKTGIDSFVDVEPISVSLDDVNQLKIIINDNDCSNTLFKDVCEKLDSDGILFTPTKRCAGLNVDEGVIFTLDQQYVSGPNTLILAPQENNRLDNSDILALATNAAFYAKGFFTGEISCGRVGYRETDGGEVLERVPTETEEMVDNDNNTSFVTISFGTQDIDAELVAASIEDALARYVSYMNGNNNSQQDFVYRVESGDTLDMIARRYDTTIDKINSSNNRHYDDVQILTDQTIINPKADAIKEFNPHIPVNLYVEKSLWSK